jgi:hypothetical protein
MQLDLSAVRVYMLVHDKHSWAPLASASVHVTQLVKRRELHSE